MGVSPPPPPPRPQPPAKGGGAQESGGRLLSYLFEQERLERDERRGLESRAAALLTALLIAFPVAGTVVKDTDPSDAVQLAGLLLLGVVLAGTLVLAGKLAAALGV